MTPPNRSVEMKYPPNRNIELKCRSADLDFVRRRAEELGARDAGVLRQEDTFFAAPHARLKLRDIGDGTAEIISYRRPDVPNARSSVLTFAWRIRS